MTPKRFQSFVVHGADDVEIYRAAEDRIAEEARWNAIEREAERKRRRVRTGAELMRRLLATPPPAGEDR